MPSVRIADGPLRVVAFLGVVFKSFVDLQFRSGADGETRTGWLTTPDTRLVRLDRSTDRWARYGWKRWQRGGLELQGRDTHSDHPAGARVSEEDPVELQNYLAGKVRAGDAVVLERLQDESLEPEHAPLCGCA